MRGTAPPREASANPTRHAQAITWGREIKKTFVRGPIEPSSFSPCALYRFFVLSRAPCTMHRFFISNPWLDGQKFSAKMQL
jgi:hypothetical protein